MTENTLDHLVIAARTLEDGAAYLRERLGVVPSPGGRHLALGTHNSLLNLGSNRYLEVIAVDPSGRNPSGPRWFGLDSEEVKSRIEERPRLLTWVARTRDLDGLVDRCPESMGSVRELERGSYRWRISFRDDGNLVASGLVPPVIEWLSAEHPTAAMADSGCSLAGLHGRSADPDRVERALVAMGLGREIELAGTGAGENEGLVAEVLCPLGRVTLD